MVDRRVAFLTAYQNARYARRYRALVEKVRAAEADKAPGKCGLAEAVARYLFKLMAYKDEYEVARLYTDGSFVEQVKNEFDGDNCASNSIWRRRCSRKPDPATGEPQQDVVRPVDAAARSACSRSSNSCAARRSTSFGYTAERRTERKLIADYEALAARRIAADLTPGNHPVAVGARRHSGENPRLRAGQAAPSGRRQSRRGGLAGSNSARPLPSRFSRSAGMNLAVLLCDHFPAPRRLTAA